MSVFSSIVGSMLQGSPVLVLPNGQRVPYNQMVNYDYGITTPGVLTIIRSDSSVITYTPNDTAIVDQIDRAQFASGAIYLRDFSAPLTMSSYSPSPVPAATGAQVTITGTGLDFTVASFLRHPVLGVFQLTIVNSTTVTALFNAPVPAGTYTFDLLVLFSIYPALISITFS